MFKPHIALLVSSLGGGGAERVICDLASFLCGECHRVTLITLDGDAEDAYRLDERVERVRANIMWKSGSVWQRIGNTYRRLVLIRGAVRAVRPDVVISFIDMTNIRVLSALVGTGIPVIVSERTDPRHHRIGRAWEMLRALTYPLAASVVVQTDSVEGWARRAIPRARVKVIPNAVRGFPAADVACPALMPAAPVIVAMGRLSDEKGFDLLLGAFADSGLPARGWSLVILGEGPRRGALIDQAERLGIRARVMLPGRTSNPEGWLRHADIFALSSRYEGFPNVLVEAMECGAPSVAFACDSGPSAIISHSVDGWLVPDKDVSGFAHALRKLADDADLRARLGLAGRDIVERFSRDVVYRQWQRLCDEVLGKRGLNERPGPERAA